LNIKDIEHELLAIHNELCIRTNMEKARRAGELLIAGKAQKPHGQKDAWVKSLGISKSTASVYVTIAKSPIVQGTGQMTIDTFLRFFRAGRKQQSKEHQIELAKAAASTYLDPGIIHGDALAWLKKQPDNSVPCFLSDPPYGLGVQYDGWQETIGPADYWLWFQPFWVEMMRVVQPGGNIVLWQAYEHLDFLRTWYRGCKIVVDCFIVRSIRQFEPLVKWTKPGASALVKDAGYNDWFVANNGKRKNEFHGSHPCAKPLEDCREFVRRYTVPERLVVDPFCGVGTIPLACYLEGRVYVGVEQSAAYCKLARKRIADSKKKRAADAA
jgi:site-specific DNA-methyltransferase (adenine-specific)